MHRIGLERTFDRRPLIVPFNHQLRGAPDIDRFDTGGQADRYDAIKAGFSWLSPGLDHTIGEIVATAGRSDSI
jgi:hypothetical protein